MRLTEESDLDAIIRAVYYAWCKAWGHNAKRVMEETQGGTFSLKKKVFVDLCKDQRALDDLCLLKTFLGKLGRRVLSDGEWRDAVENALDGLNEVVKSNV